MVSVENSPSPSGLAALSILQRVRHSLGIFEPPRMCSAAFDREEQPPVTWHWCPLGEVRPAGKQAGNPCFQLRSGSYGRPGLLKNGVSAIGVR